MKNNCCIKCFGPNHVRCMNEFCECHAVVKEEQSKKRQLIHTCKPDENGYALCGCSLWQEVKEVYIQGGSSMSIKSDLSFEEDQSNEWRERFQGFAAAHGFEGVELKAFIAQVRRESMEEGFSVGVKDAYKKGYEEGFVAHSKQTDLFGIYHKAYDEGRAALLAEVIAELPATTHIEKVKETMEKDRLYNLINENMEFGYNEALSQVRALLESKLTN